MKFRSLLLGVAGLLACASTALAQNNPTNTSGYAGGANQASPNTGPLPTETHYTPGGSAIQYTAPAPNVVPSSTPVACAISSQTVGCVFKPDANKLIHLQLQASAFVGTCQVERQLDGTTWTIYTVTVNGSTTQMGNYNLSGTFAQSEDFSETQAGTSWRINCTGFTSGTLNGRFSQ